MSHSTQNDRFLAQVSAAWLGSCMWLSHAGSALALVAVCAAVVCGVLSHIAASIIFLLVFALGLGVVWYTIRIRFDAAIFLLFAAQENTLQALESFDVALLQLGLRKKKLSTPLSQRVKGAHGLVVRLAQLVVGQGVIFLLGIWVWYVV